MLFSNYQFRFSLLGTILGLLGLVVFSGLGTWQVFRAMEKQQLQDDMDIRVQQEAFTLDRNFMDIESRKYSKVEAIGRYNPSGEILIDNMINNGNAGYHVLTPFVLKKDQTVIMVNRGWVAVGRDRKILPELNVPQSEIHIHGIISPHRSMPPLILGELDTKTKVWLYFDKAIFEEKLGKEILPVVILLDKNDTSGYIREWPKYEEKVSMHIGYAIQWYVFALIVLATYLGVNIQKRPINSRNKSDDRESDSK